MKRLALALATAALGTGCVVVDNTPPGSVNFSWGFVRTRADRTTLTYGCAQAGIDSVDVTFAGLGPQTVPCADLAGDGAQFDGLHPGTGNVRITAYRGSVALYDSNVTVTVSSGQVAATPVLVYAKYDDLDVVGLLVGQFGAPSSWATCADAGMTNVGYELRDSANQIIASGSIPCSASAPGALFRGSNALDLDTYTIRIDAAVSSVAPATFDSKTEAVTPVCSGQAFNHFGADTEPNGWHPVLYDVHLNGGTYGFCP
jgi:hypothetical protein